MMTILGVFLIVVGFVGVVLPALPGTVLIFAGMLLIAWADHFARVGVPALVLIGAIGAASYGVDFVAAAFGTRRLGASPRAMAGAAVGTLAGLFFGLPGIILGPFAGAVIGEFSAHRDWRRAGRAGVAAWIGFAIGTAVKIALAFLMLAIFLAVLLAV
jgi:uncharacterized protein YqgC (DUF456 family)